MPTTEILIFRHGETDWNRERRFQGHTDIQLNSTGIAQANNLKQLIKKHQPQAIVTSDLSRAKETAEIVNLDLGCPLFTSEQLRECRLGDPEGMLLDQIIELYGVSSWERWISVLPEHNGHCFPNGESKGDHLKRILNYLENFCRENSHFQKIAVSTHGGSLRRLVHHCDGAPEAPVILPNCVLYKISYDQDDNKWIYHGKID